MPVRSPRHDVLLLHVLERRHRSVLHGAPQSGVRELLVSPVDDAVELEDARRQDAHVASGEPVVADVVCEPSHSLPRALAEYQGVVADYRLQTLRTAGIRLRVRLNRLVGQALNR